MSTVVTDSDYPTGSPPAIPARTWKVAAVIGMGSFMVLLDTTVVNLALESIRADYDSKLSIIQWAITGYLIALAVSLPLSGWLCSRYGYGRVWRAALVLFIISSVLCALAPDPLSLIAARALKGLSGGLLVPAGHAILGSTAHPRQLGRVVGTMGFGVALGPALGPAIGGAVLEVASWRWLFWFNLPVGLLTLLCARRIIASGPGTRDRQLDMIGFLLLGSGLPLLLFGATELGAGNAHRGWSLAAVGGGTALILAFGIMSTRARHPVVDLRLFRIPVFLVGTLAACLTGINMYGGLLLIPLFLQLAADLPTGTTGALLLIMGLGTAVALPLAGQMTDRFKPGNISMVGAGAVLLSTLPFVLSQALSFTALGLLLFLRGFGLAWAQMPVMTSAYGAVEHHHMGDAAALINIAQRLGGALGAVLFVLVLNETAAGQDVYTRAFVLLAGVSSLNLVAAAILRRVQ